jgi:Ca2+-binding EF-hand superfamily protein
MKTISVCLVFAMLAPVAWSQGGPPRERPDRPDRPRAERGPGFADIWAQVDKDGDGVISLEEFQAMPRLGRLPEDKRARLFKRLDKDGDGRLSRRELEQMRRQQGGPDPRMRRLFELDKDGSGGISFEEFKLAEFARKLPPERLEALFRRLDVDGDGEITPKDRPPHPGRGPGDGRRGDPPPPTGPDPRRQIRQLDKDGDGLLSFEEFRQSPEIRRMGEDEQEERFEALDRDGNLKLDARELSKAAPARGGPPPRRERRDGPPQERPQDAGEMMED